jgi:alkylation response protein AidB-like acyl-CoA dehydrogenase
LPAPRGAGRRIPPERPKIAVIDGHAADTFIVSAWSGGGLSLFLAPADARGVTVERYPLLDTHAAANVRFDRVELGADALLGVVDKAQGLLDRVLDVARIGAAAECWLGRRPSLGPWTT